MQRFSTELLEFSSLIELLRRFVSSPMGMMELEKVEPGTDRAAIEEALADAGEGLEYVRTAGGPQLSGPGAAVRPRFGGMPDVTSAVPKLRIEGAVLDSKEIYDLIGFLDRADEARAVLTVVDRRFPRLAARAGRIGDFRSLLRDLDGKILPDGSLADTASVALNRIRRDIERQKRLIQDSLERFLRAHQEDGTLQEDFVAIRNDRFVVPVVAGQKRRIDGVIHSASGSGRTLFVEPLETIGLNNDLVRLGDDEAREVTRILKEMSEHLRQHSPAIQASMAAMSELDLIFAKADFGQSFDCVIPRISPDEGTRLVLKDARHPLLQDVLRRQRKAIVPVSFSLDARTSTLLITGPNTGGKTVTLKTAGLLALMAQSGLPVPAAEAEFPLFDQVLADIGDNQSILESLSSFSSHVVRIREMEQSATFQSLVLLDELGRATDPEEGGALGVAILDQFRMIGSMTMASTHLLALKVYGANTQGVLNASVGFDEETLEPTYQLRVGAPGKSAALAIAQRLGLPAALVERAKAAMSSSERDISQFLKDLHQKIEEATALEQDLRLRQAAVEKRQSELERDYAKRDAARVRDLERKTAELTAQFEAQARKTIEEITQLGEQKKAAEQARLRVSRTKREFQQAIDAEIHPPTPAGSEPDRPRIEEGSRVRLKNVREPARVRRIISDDLLEVEAGFMRMQVSLDDVIEVLPKSAESGKALPKNVKLTVGPKWDITYREINVIGRRAEEARDVVDKFLDDASLASIDRVRVVHGFGMGVLKKTVADLLSSHPHVDRFYPAPPAEGGAGATIVELRQ